MVFVCLVLTEIVIMNKLTRSVLPSSPRSLPQPIAEVNVKIQRPGLMAWQNQRKIVYQNARIYAVKHTNSARLISFQEYNRFK
jgi:hypothetical protein